jgi:hypothetical protein
LAFSLTIFCVSVVTITAHNGQLLWTVKRTMELPRISLMSNRQTVRFTASGQTAGRTIVHVARQLAASRGSEAKTCVAEMRSWAVKKFVFVEANVKVERWYWCCLFSKTWYLCAVCQWHLAYSNYYIEALVFSINLSLPYAKLLMH